MGLLGVMPHALAYWWNRPEGWWRAEHHQVGHSSGDRENGMDPSVRLRPICDLDGSTPLDEREMKFPRQTLFCRFTSKHG